MWNCRDGAPGARRMSEHRNAAPAQENATHRFAAHGQPCADATVPVKPSASTTAANRHGRARFRRRMRKTARRPGIGALSLSHHGPALRHRTEPVDGRFARRGRDVAVVPQNATLHRERQGPQRLSLGALPECQSALQRSGLRSGRTQERPIPPYLSRRRRNVRKAQLLALPQDCGASTRGVKVVAMPTHREPYPKAKRPGANDRAEIALSPSVRAIRPHRLQAVCERPVSKAPSLASQKSSTAIPRLLDD